VQTSAEVRHFVVAVVTVYIMASRRDVYKHCYTARCSKSDSHSHSEAVRRVTSSLGGLSDKLRARERASERARESKDRILRVKLALACYSARASDVTTKSNDAAETFSINKETQPSLLLHPTESLLQPRGSRIWTLNITHTIHEPLSSHARSNRNLEAQVP
jgi:hypothetical protein